MMDSEHWIHREMYMYEVPQQNKKIHVRRVYIDSMTPFKQIIWERYRQLRRFEDALHRDPQHLKYIYKLT